MLGQYATRSQLSQPIKEKNYQNDNKYFDTILAAIEILVNLENIVNFI